jgi:hypothetical protein
MDNNDRIRRALDLTAGELAPDTKAAWVSIRSRLAGGAAGERPRPRHLGRALVMIVAAMLVLTSAAYAYYRLQLSDPGLEAVLEAGLASTVDASHTMDELPTAIGHTPESGGRQVIAAQTNEGVTVTVDWAYADGGRVAVGFSVRGLVLPDNVDPTLVLKSVHLSDSLGTPYDEGALEWSLEAGSEPGSFHGTYVAYQQLLALPSDSVQLHLEIELGGHTVVVIPPDAPPLNGPPPTQYVAAIAPIGIFGFDFELPIYEALIVHPDQTVEAAGITMRLETLTVNPSLSTARLCFTYRALGDWVVDASLRIGDGPSVPADGFSQSPLADPVSDERCQELSFDSPCAGVPTQAVLTAIRLVTNPEMPTDASCAAAREQLLAEGSGVDFRCILTNGGGSFEVLAKPQGMTDQAAFRLIEDLFRQIVPGPWVFTVDLP